MKTINQLYPLLFLMIYVSGTVGRGDNLMINDDLLRELYNTEGDLGNNNYEICNEYYNACTYNNGKDPNIRKNIKEIIKVLVKDSLPSTMETLDLQEYDLAGDIQDAANDIIIELALHASKIIQKILLFTKKTNDSQAAIDTETKHFTLIENKNQIKKIEELEDKISLLSNNTKDLIDTINVNHKQQIDSIAIISNKITVLENLTSTDSREHREMLSIAENIQNSVMNLTETCQKIEENTRKEVTFCNLKVPASIKPNPNIWKYQQIPEKDDLDTYMINKTGCSYRALECNKYHVLAAGAFPGQLEWRVAVRTREDSAIQLYWGSDVKYSFWAGYYGKSQLSDYVHQQFPQRATPGLLAEDRYVPLYIRIKNGTLTAGAECEPEPWFTVDFAAEKGQRIERRVWAYSYYGAKFLFCPDSFTGQ